MKLSSIMSSILQINKPLVSVDWLLAHMDATNLVIIDATMQKITKKKNEFENQDIQIKNARYLDIKNVFSNTSAPFPNTMLSEERFQEQARQLGINKDSAIVVYDATGIYTSPRVWWMFKAMGHENIAVLDGGLPEWICKGYSTEKKIKHNAPRGNFIATYSNNFFCTTKDVLHTISKNNATILDARSQDRFMGLVDEPREGLRAGHIQGSKNLPYTDVQIKGKMLAKAALETIFNSEYKDKEQIIFSCGSGITACILALGAEISGLENLTVYDGSWTEWGSSHELPIEK